MAESGCLRDIQVQNLDVAGVVRVHGEIQATGGTAPVILTPAESVTLSRASHAGRLLLIPSTATAHDEYVLPTASAVGETYTIAFSAIAADADMVIIRASAEDGLTFTGGILSSDIDEAGATSTNLILPAAADNDKITLDNPRGFHLTFTATTTTNYHVSGYFVSTDTHAAFGDL